MTDGKTLVNNLIDPSPEDVILGRCQGGRVCNAQPGNILFRKIMEEALSVYCACRQGPQRFGIVHHVYRSIRITGGRFVDKYSSAVYVVASEERAEEAIDQAFRHMRRKKGYKLKKQERKRNVRSVANTKAQASKPSSMDELFTDDELNSVLALRSKPNKKPATRKKKGPSKKGDRNTKKESKKDGRSVRGTKSQPELFTDEELYSVLPGVTPTTTGDTSCRDIWQSSFWI